MGWGTNFFLLAVVFLSLATINMQEEGYSLTDVQNKMNDTLVGGLQENITIAVPYNNPFTEEYDFQQGVQNVLHIGVDAIAKFFNSLYGLVLPYVWNYVGKDLVQLLIRIVVVLGSIWLLFKAIKPFGIIYTLLDEHYEKKHDKRATWWLILVSIILTLAVGALSLIVLVVLF